MLLPLDSILQKRKRYTGDEGHKICFQRMHHAFSIANKNLKKAKKRQQKYANKNTEPVDFDIGDAVFFKKHKKRSKIDNRYLPYYRVIAKNSPLTFVIKNVLTGEVVKSHAINIKHANLEAWEISDPRGLLPEAEAKQRPTRKATYVVPPSDSDDTDINSDETEIYDPEPLINKFRHERTDSSSISGDDVPLAEISKKIRRRKYPKVSEQDSGQSNESDHGMDIDYVQTTKPKPKRNSEDSE